MAACITLAKCNEQLTALEIFLGTLGVTNAGCPALVVSEMEEDLDEDCYVKDCEEHFGLEQIIKETFIEANGGSAAVVIDEGDLTPRITCDDQADLATLFAEVFVQAVDCKAIRVSVTEVSAICTNNLDCNNFEPIESLIAKTFMKNADGCTVVLVAEVETVNPYMQCNANEGPETILRKMLIPSDEFPGHYAWAVENAGTPVSGICWGFEFELADANDTLDNVCWDSNCSSSQNPIPLDGSTTTIRDFMLADDGWFHNTGLTFEEFTVEAIDLGGGIFHYVFIFKNPLLNGNPEPMSTYTRSGNDQLISQIICP